MDTAFSSWDSTELGVGMGGQVHFECEEMGKGLGAAWHPPLTRPELVLAKYSGFFKITHIPLGTGRCICSGGRGKGFLFPILPVKRQTKEAPVAVNET